MIPRQGNVSAAGHWDSFMATHCHQAQSIVHARATMRLTRPCDGDRLQVCVWMRQEEQRGKHIIVRHVHIQDDWPGPTE
jgi:hypothetical protein